MPSTLAKARLVPILFVLGLLLRLPALPLRAIVDTHQWEGWALEAASTGIASVYGPADRELIAQARATGKRTAVGLVTMEYPRTRFFYLEGFYYIDYPPGSAILFWLVGSIYRLIDPDRISSAILTTLVNLLPLLGTAAFAWTLSRCEPRPEGPRRALGFWWNPAVVLGFGLMGYQDIVFGACAVAGLTAFGRGRTASGTAWIAAAGLLKPQGALLLPPVLAVLVIERGLRSTLRATAAVFFVALLLFSPFWTQGHLLSALNGTLRPLEESSLSAYALNLWWIAGFVMQSVSRGHLFGLARLTTLGDFQAWAGFDPVVVSRGLILIGTVVNLSFLLRRPAEDQAQARLPLAVVIQAHLYAALGTSVHENHAFLALFAAMLLPGGFAPARRVRWGTTAIVFLNLFLLQGIGSDIIPDRQLFQLRRCSGIDMSVLVAMAHVAYLGLLFLWAARRPQRLSQ